MPDAAALPCQIPSTFAAGDTVAWRASFADYPASAGWSYAVHLRGVGALDGTAANGAVVQDGDGWVATLPATGATGTDTLAPGTYQVAERVTGSGDHAGRAYTVRQSVVTITRNLVAATAGAAQTHAEKMVALLTTAIEARATGSSVPLAKSYTILGRSIEHYTLEELKRELAHYQWQVWREQHPGQLGPRRQVRFVG